MEKYPDASSNVDQESLCGRKMSRNLEGKLTASTIQNKEEEGFGEKKSLEDDPKMELPERRKSRNRVGETLVPAPGTV